MFLPAEIWISMLPPFLRARSLRALAEAYTAASDSAARRPTPLRAVGSASGVAAVLPTASADPDARRPAA